MTVLLDPDGTTIQNALDVPANRDADLVMDADLRIDFKLEGGGSGKGGGEATVKPKIDALLGL